jgi:hypothetical protein
VESRLRWEWHRINVLGEHENVEHVVDETHESPNFKAISTTIGRRGILSTFLILTGKMAPPNRKLRFEPRKAGHLECSQVNRRPPLTFVKQVALSP